VVYWDTRSWITEHLFPNDGSHYWTDPEHPLYVPLKMRPKDNTTPDAELKEQWLDAALTEGQTIEFVVDDRKRVVDMWRRRGIFCLQCAEGDY
jgi:hypothetical protein